MKTKLHNALFAKKIQSRQKHYKLGKIDKNLEHIAKAFDVVNRTKQKKKNSNEIQSVSGQHTKSNNNQTKPKTTYTQTQKHF